MSGHENNKVGRPTLYTEQLGIEICEAIATSSHGLHRLCRDNHHFPDRTQVYKWIIRYPEFHLRYMKAKAHQIELLVDDVLEISDDVSRDTIINENGKEVCNSEYVNRSRLRIDTRKWLASKLLPKLYGDKFLDKPNAESLISKIIDKL